MKHFYFFFHNQINIDFVVRQYLFFEIMENMKHICYNCPVRGEFLMIRNNLLTLLSERELKATRVASDTGIARSTLSSLTNNDSKMIQLETVNTLCRYLNVTPNDFFEYLPFDYDFKCFINKFSLFDTDTSGFISELYSDEFNADGYIYKLDKTDKQTFGLSISYHLDKEHYGGFEINSLISPMEIHFDVELQANENNEKDFNSFWNDELTVGFRTEIKKKIMADVFNSWKEQLYSIAKENDYSNYEADFKSIFHFAF